MVVNDKIITINGGHDASVTIIDKNNQLRIFEYERYINIRYAVYSSKFDYDPVGTDQQSRSEFLDYIRTQIKEEPTILLFSELEEVDIALILEKFPYISEMFAMGHHVAHCAGPYYQSKFKEALIFSIDGGGEDYEYDSTFTDMMFRTYSVYKYSLNSIDFICSNNQDEKGSIDDKISFNPGAYGLLGDYISEIKKPEVFSDLYLLPYPGKMMGLSAYGNIRKEWIQPIINLYNSFKQSKIGSEEENAWSWNTYYTIYLPILSKEMGVELKKNCFKGQDSYDLAATNQYVFEKLCFSLMKPIIEKHNKDVIISGGCALNVLFNQKLKKYLNKKGLKLYIPPIPNDCGLSYGHFQSHLKQKHSFTPFCGIDILDREKIPYFYEKYHKKDKVIGLNPSKIVSLISKGKIGGIIRGYSEVGPRALGNRSIICDPSFPNMKDILNSKVKFREWFRPFAPVCTEEDMDDYFEDVFSSPYMSYAPKVKKEFKDTLKSITHIDGTARLQTVREKDPYTEYGSETSDLFYDILCELKNRNKPPVILNTSFNIKGKPILTRVEDAFYILENTELDFIVVENYIFLK